MEASITIYVKYIYTKALTERRPIKTEFRWPNGNLIVVLFPIIGFSYESMNLKKSTPERIYCQGCDIDKRAFIDVRDLINNPNLLQEFIKQHRRHAAKISKCGPRLYRSEEK